MGGWWVHGVVCKKFGEGDTEHATRMTGTVYLPVDCEWRRRHRYQVRTALKCIRWKKSPMGLEAGSYGDKVERTDQVFSSRGITERHLAQKFCVERFGDETHGKRHGECMTRPLTSCQQHAFCIERNIIDKFNRR